MLRPTIRAGGRSYAADHKPGYDFGIGIDFASAAPMNRVVEGQVAPPEGTGGADVTFEVRRIQSTSDLEQTLNIHVDASYGSPSFCGIEAKFDFVKSSRVQTSSLFMTISAHVQLAFLQIKEPVITHDAAALADRPDIFAQRYGNYFVRGVSRGGLFVGVLRVETADSKSSDDISAELQGSYGLFHADAKTKFQETLTRHNAKVFCMMYHEGGPTDLKITDPTDPIQLLSAANDFLTSFATKPAEVAVPYRVTAAPVVIANGPLPSNAAELEHAQDVLLFCAKKRSDLLDQLNLLEHIIETPSKFDFSNGASIDAIRKAANDVEFDLDTIAACAGAAINHPGSAAMPAEFAKQRQQAFPIAVMPTLLPVAKQGPEPAQAELTTTKAQLAATQAKLDEINRKEEERSNSQM